MTEPEEFSGQEPSWCPGCGNFNILKAFKAAMTGLDLKSHQITLVSGIGQASKLPHYTAGNTFNGLHGRPLPVATAIRLANHNMIVVAVAGDGDCYGEGGNHFLHAMRRNVNVKLFVHDNQIYGLTKGQASPTSQAGMVTKVQPFGVLLEPLNPVALAVAMDASFAARAYAGDTRFLAGMMTAAMRHRGFALVDILQPCVTFNKLNTYRWYHDRVYNVGPEHDAADREAAFRLALQQEKIPTGVIYKRERPLLEDEIPVIAGKEPLVRQTSPISEPEKEIGEFY